MAPNFSGPFFYCARFACACASRSNCRRQKSLRHLRPLSYYPLEPWHTRIQECRASARDQQKRSSWGGSMTDMAQVTAPTAARVSDTYRWTQLAIGVAAMVMIANYQYGWTFFVPDIQKKFGWDRASIQWAFTLFVLFETWLVPVEGWFVDKYGPRLVVLVGGILCAIGWAINAQGDHAQRLLSRHDHRRHRRRRRLRHLRRQRAEMVSRQARPRRRHHRRRISARARRSRSRRSRP